MTASDPHNERGFHHEAVFYEGTDEFVGATLPFIQEGITAGEPVLVVVFEEKIDQLRRALGNQAERVMFRDMEKVGVNPAAIIPVWREFVQANFNPQMPVRGIGEPVWQGRSGSELAECDRHESLLNLAFDGGPPWRLLCPYDAAELPAEVLEAARRNHPYITASGTSAASEDYLAPADAPSPFEDPLPEPGPDAKEMFVTLDELVAARRLIEREAGRAGLDPVRASDLVLVGNELLTNSLRHGGGSGTLRIWREEDSIVCEVTDAGEITDRLVGRHLPKPGQVSGYGLWLVNRLCDLVQIRSGDGHTAIRARMRLPDKRPGATTTVLPNALYGFSTRLITG